MSYISNDHSYSYTQLTAFNECPFSFYLIYIDKIEKKQNAFAEAGSLVHDIIDKWAKGIYQTEQLPDIFVERYPNEVVTQFPRIMKGSAEKTYDSCLDYFINFDEFAGYEILQTEEKFETEIAGRKFNGIIDMVLKEKETGKLIVLDHKSKSLSSFKKSENEMYKQQLIYSKYVYEKYGRYPDILMFNLFKENGLRKFREFNMDEYNAVLKWAEDTIEAIENCDITEWLECKKQDSFCTEICSARGGCPNGIYKS